MNDNTFWDNINKGAHGNNSSHALMGIKNNESSMGSYNAKSHARLPGNFIYPNDIEMNRERLSKLSKSKLTEMLLERDSVKSHDILSVKPKAALSAKFNPKSLTELSANKLEQMIQPKMPKPKSLVQLAAEKIEQAIKQPTKLPEPSKMLPTLKTLAAQTLVKDKVKVWNEKANNDASINKLDKNTMKGGRRPIPIPAPRTKKRQSVAAPRKKIDEKRRALKHFTKSYEFGLKSDRDALVQLQNTRLVIK